MSRSMRAWSTTVSLGTFESECVGWRYVYAQRARRFADAEERGTAGFAKLGDAIDQ